MADKKGWPTQLCTVMWQNNVGGSDKDTEVTLFCVPNYNNMNVEIISIGVCNHTGATTLLTDLEWVDDSESDVVADLDTPPASTAIDIDDLTDRIYNSIWRGNLALGPGDSLNAEITVSNSANLVGFSFIIEYRITERSGD